MSHNMRLAASLGVSRIDRARPASHMLCQECSTYWHCMRMVGAAKPSGTHIAKLSRDWRDEE
eukprot:2728365-Amphidinium_carterae.1